MHLGKYAKRCPPLLPIQFFRGKQHIRDVILTICLCHVTEYVTNHNHWCFFGVALKHLGKYVKIGIYYLLVSYYSCLSAHLSHLEGCQLWWSHILTTDGTSPWQTNKKTAFFIRQTRVDSGKNTYNQYSHPLQVEPRRLSHREIHVIPYKFWPLPQAMDKMLVVLSRKNSWQMDAHPQKNMPE